jgi:hypothetical protein
MKTIEHLVADRLREYLKAHEDDIANNINDFGDLQTVFLFYMKRPAKKQLIANQ